MSDIQAGHNIFCFCCFFFFKQKTAYEIVSRDWSSDVCSSDLRHSQDAARCCEGLEVRGNFSCALVAVVIFLGGDIIFVQGNSSTIDLCQVLRILFAEKLQLTLSTETFNLHLSLKKIR